MQLRVSAHGFDELRARLDRLPLRMISALDQATRDATTLVLEQARINIFEQFRNERGGADAMAGALGTRITRQASRVTGSVGFGPGYPETRATPFMAIHERGGTVHHPGVFGRLQVFESSGVQAARMGLPETIVFTMRTRPHDITIPQRSFLRKALEQKRGEVVELYRRNVFDVVRTR